MVEHRYAFQSICPILNLQMCIYIYVYIRCAYNYCKVYSTSVASTLLNILILLHVLFYGIIFCKFKYNLHTGLYGGGGGIDHMCPINVCGTCRLRIIYYLI